MIAPVGAEAQPVLLLVKVNVAVPAPTPLTRPAFVTVATAALLLAQFLANHADAIIDRANSAGDMGAMSIVVRI